MSGTEFDGKVEFFDDMAQTPWLSEVHRLVAKAGGSWEDKDVLDVGCGTGRLLIGNGTEAKSITGVDLSEKMVAKAGALCTECGMEEKASFYAGDAYELPFEDDSFDIAVSTLVVFLLPEPLKAIDEMKRVVRPGGRLAMLNPGPFMGRETAMQLAEEKGFSPDSREKLGAWADVSERRHRFSPRELSKHLTDQGLVNIEHIPVLDGLGIITAADKREK
ncbi:ubiquinone/menaquinone biosynthesis C-methylase UbiE [Salsuginibacillus halophilus]|uniref:Ubiquinone/menaquinone biosynthesis C-methylase UbiE n=1 Tax=Salsuginibacillus halophilus TaxID=517424 RepID=A0A2P8HWX3_9BACI|nr:class I SAM-dependent methyltransferase [Salsuginibacillus halophilus]PSL50743.1 ubiquinone/menaquinone biosynthesis C-methylase UbiE [Salsuginibacillus halophilus]